MGKYSILENLNSIPRTQTQKRVESLVFSTLEKSLERSENKIKMGIELEFFLMKKNGEIVEMMDSKNFMLEISRLPGWALFPEEGMNNQISKVSYEVAGGGYHSLKYEHPPHMLEIAFAPYSNLHELYEAMVLVWVDLKSAALKVGVDLLFRPHIQAPALDWNEITRFSSKYKALAATREKVVDVTLRKEKWVHFTTYTAATQFHIGGNRWWKDHGRLVQNLYRGELLASLNAYELLGDKSSQIKESFFNRWQGYFHVFQKLSLMGFPKFESWNVQKWIESFCRSSLVLVQLDPFFGKDLESIAHHLSTDELLRAIQKVRDLQIVRPKLFGTLEFRADPALGSPDAIIRQAALRFGIYHHCLSARTEPMDGVSFFEIGERWRQGLIVEGLEQKLENLREDAFQALRSRGLGEEVFL